MNPNDTLPEVPPETAGSVLADAVPAPAPTPAPEIVLAGFWRRLLAFIVDGIILMLLGWGLGNGLAGVFIARPLLGLAVGLVVALVYQATLEGPPGAGQTLGKMLFGIKVVGPDAGVLRPASAWTRALVRNIYLPLNFLFALLGTLGPSKVFLQSPALGMGLLAALFAAPLVLDIYCYLADRRGRQSLHDRLARSWVVRTRSVARPAAWPLWKGHYAIVALLVGGIGWGFYSIGTFVTEKTGAPGANDLEAMVASRDDLMQVVDAHPEWPVRDIAVNVLDLGRRAPPRPVPTPAIPAPGSASVPTPAAEPKPGKKVIINVTTTTKDAPENHGAVSRALARRFLERHPELRGKDGEIAVMYGYNFSLGIYSQAWLSVIDTLPIADWPTDKAPETERPFEKIFSPPPKKRI